MIFIDIAFVLFSLVVIILVVSATLVAFSCDSVVTQANKLETNCHQLKRTFIWEPKMREELDKLMYLIIKMPPHFSAAGFFEINRSTLLSVISSVTTYFIIITQFFKL
ncbi:gustatory receptor 68a-like [Anoplophora glabripennis]|uniref:gustatory receptor 68a-like n=1 Tax=Anoplophora glabripennis TaxID=217634 RepID=UPI000874E558|nr:gustatory receptor 68a-like [Anoplophora glabripennis]